MFAGQCRERTSGATEHDPAIALDVSHRAKMLIQHLARGGCASVDRAGYSLCPGQVGGEAFAGQSKQRLNLVGC